MQTTIEQRKQRDYERFRDYSIAQMKRDEITAGGEFLNTYTTSEVSYERDDKGLFINDEIAGKIYLHEISDASAEKYDELAVLRPEVAWQAKRVHIENEHIHFASKMPPGSVYVVVVDCPENELRELGRNEFGYRLDRQMGFVQVFHAGEDKLTVYGHSFDRNDPAGIQAMYSMFNKTRDKNKWTIAQPIYETDAEDIDPKLLLKRLISAYDTELSRRHGGEWLGGRPRAELKEEGSSFVAKQTDLLEVHLEKLLSVNPKSEAANQLRYDFILAVRNRFENRVVTSSSDGSASSELSGAGAMGRSTGESVDFCGVTISAETMSQMAEMEKMGFQLNVKNEWKRGKCLVCYPKTQKETKVGSCEVCAECEELDNQGVDLLKLRERYLRQRQIQQKLAERVITHASTDKRSKKPQKIEMIKQQYGQYAGIRQEKAIGGANEVVYDTRTNELIAQP